MQTDDALQRGERSYFHHSYQHRQKQRPSRDSHNNVKSVDRWKQPLHRLALLAVGVLGARQFLLLLMAKNLPSPVDLLMATPPERHHVKQSPLQRLVDQYFDGVIVEKNIAESNESDLALISHESVVVRCDGEPDLNSTCLFSNIYVHEGASTPCAYVIKGSPSANRFKNLPRLQYYGTYEGNDEIKVVEYGSKEQLLAAAREADRFPSDLTAAFTTRAPQNIGHGIFDGIWGIFVGMVRMGLKDTAKFHPYLVKCVDEKNPRYGREFGLNNFGESVVNEVYRALSLEDSLSACEPGRLGHHAPPNGGMSDEVSLLPFQSLHNSLSSHFCLGSVRFPLFVHGNGHLGQRNVNAQYELPGGRIAMQKFRDRIFSSFGIVPTKKHTACPWENTKLEANIFDNKRYSPAERSSIMDIVSTEFPNVSVHFIDWSELKTTREQIQKVADTDI
jgi:hypothetical protein